MEYKPLKNLKYSLNFTGLRKGLQSFADDEFQNEAEPEK